MASQDCWMAEGIGAERIARLESGLLMCFGESVDVLWLLIEGSKAAKVTVFVSQLKNHG